MSLPARRLGRRPLPAACAMLLGSAALVAGCASSSPPGTGSADALPTREQAFELGEVQINQILIDLHQQPTNRFLYSEGLCNETDNQHGHVSVNYTIPGQYGSAQAAATVQSVGAAMKELALGTPEYQTQPDGVYVGSESSGLLFGVEGATLTFAYQSCYATPAPSGWWRSNGLQPLTVSPAPTSTAQPPAAVPSSAGASTSSEYPSNSMD